MKNRRRTVRDRDRERGSAIVVVLLVTMLLLLLGAALLGTSETESAIAANDYWAEGAFQAAEAAVQLAVDELSGGNTGQVVPLTTIGDRFAYRSGGMADTAPQPPQLVDTAPATGYAIAEGAGYGSSGYAMMVFEVNGTGTGPRNTQREVEVQVLIGPVPE
jgi:hypothetical protein